MKKRTKIIISVLLILFFAEFGVRVYKHSITDVLVINPETKTLNYQYHYNGNTYVDFRRFVDKCITEEVLLNSASDYDPEPYTLITNNLVKKYVTRYGYLREKMWNPSEYVLIDKADDNNIFMFAKGDKQRYVREDFIFPSFETSKVEAIVFDAFMDDIVTDKQVVADFMDAIYKQGKATDKIAGYLDKEYNTHIYFKYEGCDCVIEFIGRFSIDDGKFTMYKDIKEW